ncbi:contactin-associated protein-like 5 [Dendronephthya gigantea]|uniref:contactin-associated protein-like 5 n=1 Tax=Dendronephthya gigantea TaxID=151771 RepID=UPI00106D5701|nr:contactin-associated protein-like 5 [Dendronephthya gigantea]
MESGDIKDDQINASSEFDKKHRPANGRLNFTPQNGRKGAWSSRNNNLQQWFQVDFQRSTLVTGISTQGRNSYNQFVKNYTVSFSEDGKKFQKYSQNGGVKEFQGNSDRDSVVHHVLFPCISARFIRIHPTAWNGHISMRVEFYGCHENYVVHHCSHMR